MKKYTGQAAIGLAAMLTLTHVASAAVASTQIFVQDITAQIAVGSPTYVGLQTYALFVLYQNPTDVMVNHGLASFTAISGTFFNANPAVGSPDNPLGLIAPTAGLTPVNPAFFGIPGYAAWEWDTNLSSDNSPLSQADPGSSQTPTQITGGAFTVPPPIGVMAGPGTAQTGGLPAVQIGQITMTAGGLFLGHTIVLTQNPLGGNPIVTEVSIFIPAPGALALLGLGGLSGTRRRRA